MQWHNSVHNINISNNLQNWLTKPYSISGIMRKICNDLKLELIGQSWSNAFSDEEQLLEINEPAFIRRIYLVGNGNKWSYGRVVIPSKTYKAFSSKFEQLNTNLIGETILYNNPKTKRSRFTYAKVDNNQPLFKEAAKGLECSYLAARRSLFNIENHELLVTDVYLPEIPNYPHACQRD